MSEDSMVNRTGNACRTQWQCGSHVFSLSPGRPLFMGIVNVTPDSFSDGGKLASHDAIVTHAEQLAREGADILDIGGESTRPGAAAVTEAVELERVIPAIMAIRQTLRIPISVDTTKSEVAKQALAAGADIVNDVSGLTFDPRMIDVCAATGAGIVLMHMQGTPQTMQIQPHYIDVVAEVRDYLQQRLDYLASRGIEKERCVLDPGIGFGKTPQHNVQLLQGITELRRQRPVLIGHSRKRFIGKIVGKPVDERLYGTIGVSLAAIHLGAEIIRVHDVAASRDAWLAWSAVVPPETL